MLTAGEIITNVGRFYVNQSAGEQVKQPALRARLAFFERECMTRAWTVAPLSQRHGNGTISIATTGLGPFPTDFSGIGPTSSVFMTTGGTYELGYMPEQQLLANATQYPDQGSPLNWTRIRQTIAGVAQMQVWPPPLQTSVVQVNSYNRRCLDPIDFPGKPTVAAGGAGVLAGSYKWKAVYVWADGTTEGGFESDAFVPATTSALVTIPASASRYVTAVDVYRTLASGTIFKKSGSVTVGNGTVYTVSGVPVVQYDDNVADTDLGANCPLPAAAVTGVEQFPEDFIETTLFEGVKALAMSSQGDLRDAGFWAQFLRECRRMWADQKPGQNTGRPLIVYGGNRSAGMFRDVRYRYNG